MLLSTPSPAAWCSRSSRREKQLGSTPPSIGMRARECSIGLNALGTEGRTPCGQGVDFAVPATVWKTCGMPSLDIPQVYHTNPPPAHTAPERASVETAGLFFNNKFLFFLIEKEVKAS